MNEESYKTNVIIWINNANIKHKKLNIMGQKNDLQISYNFNFINQYDIFNFNTNYLFFFIDSLTVILLMCYGIDSTDEL